MESSNIQRFCEIMKILKNSGLTNGFTPKKVYDTFESLGPSFIKLGQILSARVDLLPIEYCTELSKLRTDVAPMPYEEVEEILRNNYENIDEIFVYIERTPLGSASIAQVHKAKLKKNNKEVAIKIRRPNIDQIMSNDLNLLRKAIHMLQLHKLIKVIDIDLALDQIYDTTMEETNFKYEADHLREFKERNKDSEYIDCPIVYTKLCTEDVIVMEYIDGIKVYEKDKLKEANYNLNAISNVICENYIKQTLEDGFFHADPHPDNIMIKDDKVIFIDFGMVGRLSDSNKELIKKCIKAIMVKDFKTITDVILGLSTRYDKSELDYQKLESDVTKLIQDYLNVQLENINIAKFATDMFNMLREHKLMLDKDVTMMVRGDGVIEGVLKNVNPKISFLNVLSLSKYSQNEVFTIDKVKEKSTRVIRSVDNLIDMPGEVNTLLKSINSGQTKFRVELSESANQVDKLENLVHEVVIGFIDGCLVIATAIIDIKELKIIGEILVFLLTTWLVIKMIKDIIHRGY